MCARDAPFFVPEPPDPPPSITSCPNICFMLSFREGKRKMTFKSTCVFCRTVVEGKGGDGAMFEDLYLHERSYLSLRFSRSVLQVTDGLEEFLQDGGRPFSLMIFATTSFSFQYSGNLIIRHFIYRVPCLLA